MLQDLKICRPQISPLIFKLGRAETHKKKEDDFSVVEYLISLFSVYGGRQLEGLSGKQAA
jgi:hypothetical protein